MNQLFSVEGQSVLITGSSTGIGKSMAELFSKAGAQVVINSRKEEKVKQAIEELESQGLRIKGFAADIRVPEQAEALVKYTNDVYGKIDVLINNAGGAFSANAEEISPNGWNSVINTNLTTAFLMSRAVYPYMKKQGKGNIINISTIGSFGPFHRRSHYAAAKAGLNNLTQTLAEEWGKDNIRVNGVSPGAILTELAIWNTPENREKINKQIPLDRPGRPEEISNVVLFLCTEASSYINGTIIRVDGGLFETSNLNT